MTLPFDTSKPLARPNKVVSFTDDETFAWLNNQAQEHDLELSLLCHRIFTAAKTMADGGVLRRRASDAA